MRINKASKGLNGEMKLFIKLIRDMKQSVGQLIALSLVVAVGAFFHAGLVTYSDNLSAYAKEYFSTHNLSDLNVYYDQISKEEAAGLSGIAGIRTVEARYTLQAAQTLDGYKTSLTLHSIPDRNEINTLAMVAGHMPSGGHELVLDSHYAEAHRYQVGDPIDISVNGKTLTFVISGLGENVEHVKKNDTQDHEAYGVAYMAEAAIPAIAGGLHYNELMVDAEEGYDIDELGRSIAANSDHLAYAGQESKERSFGYSAINDTIHNNKLMSVVIPLMLFLIEAAILYLTMGRIMDAQRNQVGIMKALGVRDGSIMLHYMGYPVLVAIVGTMLGSAIAAAVFIPFVSASSARSYSLPGIQFSLSYWTILPPILFSGTFGALSCYLSGSKILKERAAQAMRPKPPKAMKKLLIEGIPGVWRRLSYRNKLIVRNLLLNKRKAFASSVGVIVSTVLLITAFGTQSALLQVADQVEDVYTYDLRVDYAAGTASDAMKAPPGPGIARSHPMAAYPVALAQGDEQAAATLVVTEQANDLIHYFDGNGDRIGLDHDGVLVPQSYADEYGIAAGDLIRIAFTAPELGNASVEMKVARISAQYSNPSFYCTPAYLESLGIDYRPTSQLVDVANAADLDQVRAFFEQERQVEAITDQGDLKKSAQYIVRQNSFVFIMFIVCAVILSFGAIYTISSINIYERSRELATLKVLGYPKSKIFSLILLENMLLTALSVLVAIPISYYAYAFIIHALSSAHQQIPDQLSALTLLVSAVLACLLTAVASLLLGRKVAAIPMIESLKSIE